MSRWRRGLVVWALGASVASGWARSEESCSERAEWLHPVTLGIRAQENEAEGVGDILLPLWRGPRSVLLANVRGAMSDHDEEEVNVGLGVRHLLDTRIPFMVGGFVFYDGRWTRHHNRFDQLGFSAEVLSDWVDGRFNYYLPNHDTALVDREDTSSIRESRQVREGRTTAWGDPYGQIHSILQDRVTTWTRQEIITQETIRQFFENREAALEGWDAEIGLRLPLCERWFETRVFAGYQYFDHPFGGHLKGAQGRIELRALAGRLLLDAQVFENRELNQSDWRAGVRLRLPFEMSALAQGRNPFAPPDTAGRRDLRARFDEMVMRDPKIQIQKSGYVEDVAKRALEKKSRATTQTRTERETEVIAEGVTFVDGDKGSDGHPGTAEQPKETIQGGVEGAHASSRLYTMAWPDGKERRLVYVRSASQPYAGAEVTTPDIGLFGSGVPIPGFDGKVFGGGASPRVLAGAAPGMVVHDTARGMGITGLDFAGVGQATGIRSASGELLVWNNDFRELTHGLVMDTFDPDVDSWFLANRFAGITEHGMAVAAEGDGTGLFRFRAEDNTFQGGQVGISGQNVFSYNAANVLLARNHFSDLEDGGLLFVTILATDSTGDAQIALLDNVAVRSGTGFSPGIGLGVNAYSGDGDVVVYASGNRVDEATLGLYAMGNAVGQGHAQVMLSDNLVSNCDEIGIFGSAMVIGSGNAEVFATQNLTRDTGETGFFLMSRSEAGVAYVETAENIAEGANIGMDLYASSWRGFAGVDINRDTVRGNHIGLMAEADAEGGDAALRVNHSTADGNQSHGMVLYVSSEDGVAAADVSGNELKGNGGEGLRLEGRTSAGTLYVFADQNLAEDNAGDGMRFDLVSMGSGIQFTGQDNVLEGSGDNGLRLDALSIGDGTVDLILANNVARGSGAEGIFGRAQSGTGSVFIHAQENMSDDNDDTGLLLYGSSMGNVTLVAAGNTASGSQIGDGIEMKADSDAAAMILATHNTVSNNAALGLNVSAISENGSASAFAENNTASHNGIIGIYLEAEADGGDATIDLSGNTLIGNAGDGAHLLVLSDSGSVFANVAQNTAIGNDNGMYIYARTLNGAQSPTVRVDLDANTCVSNREHGIELTMAAPSQSWASLLATGNQLNGNSENGLDLNTTLAGATAAMLIQSNQFRGNQSIGFRHQGNGTNVIWNATGNDMSGNMIGAEVIWNNVIPDVTNFAFTQNSLNNSLINLLYSAPFDIHAQQNWWGETPPDAAKILQASTGAIDWSNWLTAPPNLP